MMLITVTAAHRLDIANLSQNWYKEFSRNGEVDVPRHALPGDHARGTVAWSELTSCGKCSTAGAPAGRAAQALDGGWVG